MITLACDPDLHRPAFAAVAGSPGARLQVVDHFVIEIPAEERGASCIEYFVSKNLSTIERLRLLALRAGKDESPLHLLVEMPKIYPLSSSSPTRAPNNIVHLAAMAGACALICRMAFPFAGRVALVEPKTWKGQKKKLVPQKHALEILGIKYDVAGGKVQYCVPKDLAHAKRKSDWLHLCDAIALAVWNCRGRTWGLRTRGRASVGEPTP